VFFEGNTAKPHLVVVSSRIDGTFFNTHYRIKITDILKKLKDTNVIYSDAINKIGDLHFLKSPHSLAPITKTSNDAQPIRYKKNNNCVKDDNTLYSKSNDESKTNKPNENQKLKLKLQKLDLKRLR
jgi:hypothetical protein